MKSILRNLKVTVIGPGRQGSALLDGWILAGLPIENILVWTPNLEKGITTTTYPIASSLEEAIAFGDKVVLAVKPDKMGDLCEKIRPYAAAPENKDTTYISVALGLSHAFFQAKLGLVAMVVSMTNTSAAFRKAMTVWCAKRLGVGQHATTKTLFEAAGEEGEVLEKDEHLVRKSTGVIGSSPAAVYRWCAETEASAKKMGFSDALARKMARQAVIGAGAVLESSDASAEAEEARITSPGSATEQMLNAYDKAGFGDLVNQATWASANHAEKKGSALEGAAEEKLKAPGEHSVFVGVQEPEVDPEVLRQGLGLVK